MDTSCEDEARMELSQHHVQWRALILVILKFQSPQLHKSDSLTSHPLVTLNLQTDTAYAVHTFRIDRTHIRTC